HIRRPYLARHHRLRVLEPRQVMRPALSIREDKCRRVGSPPGTPGPLHVVRRSRRHVPHYHRLQLTYVNPELERRRARKRVHLAAPDALVVLGRFVRPELGRVLASLHRYGVKVPIQVPVMVVVRRARRYELAATPKGRTYTPNGQW